MSQPTYPGRQRSGGELSTMRDPVVRTAPPGDRRSEFVQRVIDRASARRAQQRGLDAFGPSGGRR